MDPWNRDWGATQAVPSDSSATAGKPWERDWKAPAKPTKGATSWGGESRGRIGATGDDPQVLGEGVPLEAASGLKRGVGEIAALADLPASLPAMVAGGLGFTGGVLGTGAAVLKDGKPISRKELVQEGTRIGEETAAPLANPVQRLMRYFGHEDDYTQSDVQSALGVFSGWLKKGNKWIEEKTGGAVLEEDAAQIANAVMTGGPVEAAKLVMKARPRAKPGAAKPDKRVEPGPLPPREPSTTTEPPATEADDFIKRMDKESVELSKEMGGREEVQSIPAGKPRIKPKSAGAAESTAATNEPERPFADESKWGTPLLERLAAAADTRLEETRDRFDASKTADRRRRQKSLATEDLADHSRRLEDATQQIRDELATRKSGASSGLGKALGAAGVGAGIAAGAYVAGGEELEKKLGMSAMAAAVFAGFPEGARTLGTLMKISEQGSRVLERLPQGNIKFPKEQIISELNRQDVPILEKTLMKQIIDSHPEKAITAEQLIQQFKLATQDFKLEPVETEKYSSYGIQNIRPESFFTEAQEAHSTVWKLPDKWNIPAKGHFEEMGPNQYGHTRSFEEDGIRHVVEIQSDLLQHQKELTGIRRTDAERALQVALDANVKSDLELSKAIRQGNTEYASATRRIIVDRRARIHELEAELAGTKVDELDPIAKAWPRRLIQEEIAQAGREGLEKIRFASADTVAKVEGWPEPLSNARERLADLEKFNELQSKQPIGPSRQTLDLIAHERELIEGLRKNGQRFSDRDQPIYDRYKDEITKYLKSLGATPYTDPHGHTWWEVRPQKGVPPRIAGKVDPKLLAGAATGIVAGAAAGGDDHRVGGAIAGALGGALLVGAFSARMFSKAEGGVQARELSSSLDKLVGKQKAKQLELLKFATSVPKDYSQHAEEIYHSLEDPAVKLSPRAAELKIKYVDPIMRQNALLREDLKKKGVEVGEDVDAYVHRIPKGKPSIFEQLEQTSPQGKTLSQFAPPLEERTVFKLIDPDTKEVLYGVKDETSQGYKVYRDKKIVGSGKISPKLWKEGKVPFGGRSLERSQATTKDIEMHTPVEYHHDALASAIASNARLVQIRNNNVFLENLLKSPEASDIALKNNAPKNWREIPQIPQLRGYKFAPRIANVLEDFAGRQELDLGAGIAKVSRVLTGSLFWNPLPHIFNVLDHSIVQRGLVSGWLNPTAYPRLMRTTLQAAKAVTEQNEAYLRFVKEGAGLMYPNVLLQDFSGKVLEQLGHRPEMGAVATAWGYANPAEMVRRIYSFSRKSLWSVNDILMMQAYLEKEMVKPETAIADVEKHIPNYRVPDVVLGSRMISQALQSPIVTAFGRYDYGRMRSYGELVKSLVGKEAGLKDRAKALDQVAMLTVMGVVVYPLLMDNAARALTGNPNAEATRFGAASIPYLVYSYLHGKKQFSQIVGSAFPTGMAAKAGIEIVSNRDLYTGKHLFESSSDIGSYLARQLAPLGTAQRIESGQLTPGQFAASAVGIRSPQTPEQKRDLATKRRREQTRKRIDAILSR